ncbi:alpha-1,3/1,6-mannosyltransferase ALG2 [Ixodes scapularis]
MHTSEATMRRRKESGEEADDSTPKQRVVLLHLDLGVGGAERLVVDAALALQARGHSVQFLTTHHDRSHCFPETTDGTLEVTTVCDWMPRSVLGHLYAVCSYLRMIFAAVYLVWFSDLRPDVVVCDQVSACVPVLKWGGARVVFYCHFPDLMLAERSGLLRRIYRWPIDTLEQWSTGKADTVLVNSKFTGDVFRRVFPKLADVPLHVLHPTTSLSRLDRPLEGSLEDLGIHPSGAVFLSLNRYERKKNLGLALRALELAIREVPCHLVVAGGYDVNHRENVEHYEELQNLAKELNIAEHVSFLKSPAEPAKQQLLHSCRGVIYTPANEHFGIVPLEAMYMRRPVVACDSGGPTETVADGETGFLCAPTAESFASAMVKLAKDRSLSQEMGESGRERALALFSWDRFERELNRVVFESKEAPRVEESAAVSGSPRRAR